MVVLLNVSELHNRLSHLVNYSSQLIFVSGDSMADQQRTLSDFLSSQQDDTDISFFSASSDKKVSDYRGAICRQLGDHKVGSFVRPLQQLLSGSDDGLEGLNPYLVCITQAEQLENSFLQELWDWVMHSQLDNKNIHLNIILFGESSWAKASQEWLPSQNSHKPVLLSSESINPVGFDVNALEALMADKSSWFSSKNQPIVTNKWFISSVLSLFLVVFVGLMAWQYPDQVRAILNGNTDLTNNVDDNTAFEPMLFAQNESDNRQAIVNIDPNDKVNIHIEDAESNSYQTLIEVVEPTLDNSLQKDAASSVSLDEGVDTVSVTETLLVTNWADAISNTPELTKVNSSEYKAKNTTMTATQANSDVLVESTKETNTAVISPTNKDGDFQVPDIISVEQLDEQLSITQTEEIVTVERPITVITEESTEKLQETPILDNSTIDYRFDETTLLSLPTDTVVLQLSGIQNPSVLENYLNNNDLKSSTWVYETQRYGGPWYVVLYRQTFGSIESALIQLSNLPEDVKEAQPFAKSINQIQQEISLR